MLFLHVQKAFDNLNHRLLLHKLRKIGPSRIILTWFENYLNRTQIVKHNGQESNELKVLSVIPNSSILGQTHFILYINDTFNRIVHIK